MLSVFDIFKIGVGPSSSHTVGPMLIARRFLLACEEAGHFEAAFRVMVELQGSLALTGIGHGTDRAVLLGLSGETPEKIDTLGIEDKLQKIRDSGCISLLGRKEIAFDARGDVDLRGDIMPDLHPNGMRLVAFDDAGAELFQQTWYSVGGGFVRQESEMGRDEIADAVEVRYPFGSAAELLRQCDKDNISVHRLIARNEDSFRPRAQTLRKLDAIWKVMSASIDRGLRTEGILPGGLRVNRRAPALYGKLTRHGPLNEREALFDWLNVFAMAVNEENAAGGQVVTAPTNGAAGIIPAVIKFYCAMDGLAEMEKIRRFLMTAGGIGILYKQRASISGAEMGCQGEVGVACSMAAAGLAAVWGGTPQQIEHAAEIGMEHNLGLTCDPVGGLVQIPCIERNAIGAVKAVNAARLALQSDGPHKVSLDQVIETMRQTGVDMNRKYKETSEGGLAVNVVEC
ncbi:L-serine ammonia-lyase [Aquisalinus flavus]|uniref:L-serine dehydratase n=1 Tax=Aquisalinus flavus TaxID=1526572 RepID=A0A8J2Y4L3_9PROT|nr:L-serine ammonia-lyase [Aquisalinus flavus]MBD0426872.1 L-serine ammonia-lyase [Aquisalinus flavus]UNE46719.1 L-serine ammonia-lyase [Aquisalinus flavus]GGC96636.1 L-serine dehydratase [Aquisalinus flavus]